MPFILELMKAKKIPVKVSLTPKCIQWINEIGEGEPTGRVASLILESCKNWRGDLFELLFAIRGTHKKWKKKGDRVKKLVPF